MMTGPAPALLMNDGIGDALRAAAVLWRTKRPGPRSITVDVEGSPDDGALQVWRAMDFVNVNGVERRGAYAEEFRLYRRSLGDPEAWIGGWHGDEWAEFKHTFRHGLSLPQEAFDSDGSPFNGEWLESAWQPTGSSFGGGSYTVVQPSTTAFKSRRLQMQIPWSRGNYVIIGSAHDRDMPLDLPAEFGEGTAEFGEGSVLDLRGETTIREALSWIYCANSVIGVESWAVIAGALFGLPVVQEIDERAWNHLAPTWHVLFPSMGFRLARGMA